MTSFFTWIKLAACAMGLLWTAAHAQPEPAGSPARSAPTFSAWLDPSGTATLDSVQQQAGWEPFTGWKSWGYGPEPIWLRVTVPAAATADAPAQFLVLRPPFLDRVTFHDPAMGAVRKTGDFLPASQDALGRIFFAFEVPASVAARDLWIKVETTSARVVHLSLMPLAQAQSFSRQAEWAIGAVWLLSLVFLAWALMQWRLSGDRVMRAFAFKQFMISVWGFFILGFARITIGPSLTEGTLTLISSLSVPWVVGSVMWFFATLLAEFQPRPWMLRVIHAWAWLFFALGLLTILGPAWFALEITNTVVPLALAWVAVTLWAAKPQQAKLPISKLTLLGYLCFYVLFNSIPPLTYVGLIQESPILLYGNVSVLVADGLVMLIILTVRQRWFKEQHLHVTTQLLMRQEQARMDRQYLDEQRQLLTMLAHEMKTPLANLRIWMAAGDKGGPMMERAIQDMNQVLERCLHAGQLQDQSLRPSNEWVDADVLTRTVLASSRQPQRVNFQLAPGEYGLLADAQMLSIILSNVLENAFKYSPPDTPIDLQLASCAGPTGAAGWLWRVENTIGTAGLPDPDKVFDKYYRAPHARRQSGSGLGLFLVKSLLVLMQGEVKYIPLPGRVRFEVWLPVEPAEAPPRADGH